MTPGAAVALKLCLFDHLEVWIEGQPVDARALRRESRTLLKCLALNRGRTLSKRELVETVFGAQGDAFDRTWQALKPRFTELRLFLEPGLVALKRQGVKQPGRHSQFVKSLSGAYRFPDEAPCWVDVGAFEQHAASGERLLEEHKWRQAVNAFERAEALYRGDLLRTDASETWVLPHRKRYANRLGDVLEGLARARFEAGAFDEAVACCARAIGQRAALARDHQHVRPNLEGLYRLKMQAHHHGGDPQGLTGAYEALLAELGKDGGIPSKETDALYKDLRTGNAARPRPAPAGPLKLDNLPRPPTNFIGRHQELGAVARALRDKPLVTLTGSGGCGKTRLAVELGRGLRGEFADGVWLVELADLRDAAQVAQAVAQAVGAGTHGRLPLQTLQAALAGKQVLLILDNCEHLIEACADLVKRLCERCRGLTVLATSREPLNVPGERVVPLAGLSLPAAGALARTEVKEAEAVKLFVARAAEVAPGFDLTQDNASHVAQICRLQDGLPLALEMAAVWVQPQGALAEIAAQLQRSRLRIRGLRGVDPRHQTLWATCDWSYQLLSAQEQRLFRLLSIFDGGFTVETALHVLDPKPTAIGDIGLHLLTLARKSLCQAVGLRGEFTRYRMLDMHKEFGRERLAEAGELADAGHRHWGYFTQHLSGAQNDLNQGRVAQGLRKLNDEYGNLRAALAFTLEQRMGEEALAMASNLTPYWGRRGLWREGRLWLSRAVAETDPLGDHPERARAVLNTGYLAREQEDAPAARALLQEGAAMLERLGLEESAIYANALNLLGTVLARLDEDPAGALDCYEKAQALFERLDLPSRAAEVGGNRALLHSWRGDLEAALSALEAVRATFERLNDPTNLAHTLLNLGEVHHRLGDFKGAVAHLERAALSYEKLDHFTDQIHALTGLGRARLALALGGHPEWWRALAGEDELVKRALKDFEKALAVQRKNPQPHGQDDEMLGKARVHLWLGVAKRCLGRPKDALVELKRALEALDRSQEPEASALRATCLAQLGCACLHLGEAQCALAHTEGAVALLDGAQDEAASVWAAHAWALQENGALEAARTCGQKATAIVEAQAKRIKGKAARRRFLEVYPKMP